MLMSSGGKPLSRHYSVHKTIPKSGSKKRSRTDIDFIFIPSNWKFCRENCADSLFICFRFVAESSKWYLRFLDPLRHLLCSGFSGDTWGMLGNAGKFICFMNSKIAKLSAAHQIYERISASNFRLRGEFNWHDEIWFLSSRIFRNCRKTCLYEMS